MKPNRFQNGALENAKEMVGSRGKLPVTGAGTRQNKSTVPCAAPRRTAPRRRRAVAEDMVTTIAAKVDVGFGNTLFIRGEGEGLSWDNGQPLVCVEGLTWIWSRRRASEPVTFKLLINDQLWSRGDNFRVEPGGQIEVAPEF